MNTRDRGHKRLVNTLMSYINILGTDKFIELLKSGISFDIFKKSIYRSFKLR